MKSIYSLEVLQRIVDHWHIGQIEDVTYFEKTGRNTWRHYLDTPQGEFELYSYLGDVDHYAESQLKTYLQDRHGHRLSHLQKKQLVHSFDRYHVLLQLTRKHRITPKQAATDLNVLLGSTIEKAFRVYGTIFQLHLNEANVNTATVLVSYGQWSIQDYQKGRANIVVDTRMHSRDRLDEAIEIMAQAQPRIEKYILKNWWFELYLSNDMSLHFVSTSKFSAIEVHIPSKKNDLLIFEESEIYYRRDLR